MGSRRHGRGSGAGEIVQGVFVEAGVAAVVAAVGTVGVEERAEARHEMQRAGRAVTIGRRRVGSVGGVRHTEVSEGVLKLDLLPVLAVVTDL